MIRLFATVASGLLVLSAAAPAQVPRAVPVDEDPPLAANPGEDLFERGRNLHDAALAAADLNTRVELFNRAAAVLTAYLDQFGNHRNAEMAWWYLGNSYYQGGNIENAKLCFHTILNRYGQGRWAAAAAYTLAADHYNKTEYNLAGPLFERFAQLADRREDRAKGLYYAGTCHRMLGRDREAVVAFRKVVEDPAGALFAAQAKVALGHLAVRAGKLEEALPLFEEVAGSPAVIKVRGEAALQAALTASKLDKLEVSDHYLRMVLSTPGMEDFRVDAQTTLLINLFGRQDYQGVIKAYEAEKLRATGEKEASRLMVVARSYMRLKDPTKAMTLFREVEKHVPPAHDMAFQASYYRLLCFFQAEGRHVPEQVDAFLKLYRKSRPDDTRIHTALLMKAETLFAAKDVAAAAKVYSEIDAERVSAKNRAGLYYQRGWCLAEAGDPQGAIRSLTEFMERYPDDARVPTALAKRAQAFVAIGEPASALKDFDALTQPGIDGEMTTFAWLESARLCRAEGRIDDMITRYRALLETSGKPSEPIQAEANYWIGQGLTKKSTGREAAPDAAKQAVPYLEAARKLRPATYAKHAGLLLILGYFANQDTPRLNDELDLAIKSQYAADIPEQVLSWAGLQAFNAEEYDRAERYLKLVANPAEPRETPKEIWRYLAKSRLETGDAQGALTAVSNVLEVEDNPSWKADGLLDKGRAL
ncbi:MAG: tetratricopeptide repeat protein, partial [Akkermansiaceae bacterium]|nr:tetratricopeptide repeat protein [Akkermansiaceae bacterium]